MPLVKRRVTLGEKIRTLNFRGASNNLLKTLGKLSKRWSTNRVVTLDIDTSAIRLLETKGKRVVKWASASFEPGEVGEGAVSNWQAVSTKVKEVMSSSGIKGGKVAASLSGLYSISRILTVPNSSAGLTLQQAVLEAAREILPLSVDKLYLSWQIVTDSESERRALIVGVPRDMVDSEVQALGARGISPRILELKAMALARVANKEHALILNTDSSSFDIVIVVNSIPEVMRTIPWRQDEFTAEDRIEHLALTLELTVGFYNSRYPDTPLNPATPLFITGQISGDPTLVQKLQARLTYPIEPLSPPLEYPENLPISLYAINIGLALKETTPAKNLEQNSRPLLTLNLLPESYRPWRPSRKQILISCIIVAGFALVFPFFQATTQAMNKAADMETRYNILSSELQRRQLEIKNRLPLQAAINEYNIIIGMGGNFVEDLNAINGEAGSLGVEVQSISHQGKSITVTCQASKEDYITFRAYLAALEKTGRFTAPIPPPEGYPYTWGGVITLTPKAGR